jgi:hypothetical protein
MKEEPRCPTACCGWYAGMSHLCHTRQGVTNFVNPLLRPKELRITPFRCGTNFSVIVIPAKAGIHVWIPADAGMTLERVACSVGLSGVEARTDDLAAQNRRVSSSRWDSGTRPTWPARRIASSVRAKTRTETRAPHRFAVGFILPFSLSHFPYQLNTDFGSGPPRRAHARKENLCLFPKLISPTASSPRTSLNRTNRPAPIVSNRRNEPI